MMQSLWTIVFAILICDVIKGNITSQNNNEYTQSYEYEYKMLETPIIQMSEITTFQKILNKTGVKIGVFFITLSLLIALMINLWLLITHWFRWLSNNHIAIRIRAPFRIFWQRFVNLFTHFHRYLTIRQTSNEPRVSYNSRQGAAINI